MCMRLLELRNILKLMKFSSSTNRSTNVLGKDDVILLPVRSQCGKKWSNGMEKRFQDSLK